MRAIRFLYLFTSLCLAVTFSTAYVILAHALNWSMLPAGALFVAVGGFSFVSLCHAWAAGKEPKL